MNNPKQELKKALAAASASLLATSAVQANESWNVDAEVLYYQEQDGRVSDASLKSLATKSLNDEDKLTISLQLDSLTGASPTGAMIQNQAQTFTQASGNGSYSIQAGELPVDRSFKDTRLALSGSYLKTLESGNRFTSGLSFSKEYDYLHLGASGSYAFDFDNNNRTLSFGAGLSSDTVEPVGGSPTPGSLMGAVGAANNNASSESKTGFDVLVGFTQVINRRSLVQLNYSMSLFDGYLNDPYKFVSVLDDAGELEAIARPYRFESRPDSRLGHNLYAEYKYRFDSSIANVSYRYHTDDWGVNSHTVETRYRWLMDDKQWLEPNARFYSQSAADFYTPWVLNSDLPALSSADYRLNAFEGITVGLAYKRKLGKGAALGFSVESYQTTGKSLQETTPSSNVIASVPTDLDSTIMRINYSFKW